MGDALASVDNVDKMLPVWGSVRSAMDDVIMPPMHTIFDRVNEGTPARDSVGVTGDGEAAGFHVDQIQALQPHNARTLDDRGRVLQAHHDEAVQIAAEEVHQRHIEYLTGSAAHFGSGRIDVMPVTRVYHGTGGVPG
ncbi:class I SAM-dependent methyltransferase [Rhodococcus sp. ACS1]|uniref:class I SAM-dependent methyltransferase n=1 Tax=Rhodococcus sp. ACS1 TaxID=2028570 RepID=UPI0015C83890|nr:class I SAM-dependent methyltransferase [Rhodococcus sp. ACS1]